MAPIVTIELPLDRLLKEDCIEDEYLLNQMDSLNDNPEEDNLPLRKWIIRETHAALAKHPKTKEVLLKPKADKSSHTEFEVKITGHDE